MSSNFFRANVGACIVNPDGRILALKRKTSAENPWQMPQGGIESDETPQAAVLREMKEETGLNESSVQIIAEYPEWLAYELPQESRNQKVGRGQVQKWFILRAAPDASPTPDGTEFEAFTWLTPAELIPLVVPFRQLTYTRVFAFLDQILNRAQAR